MNFSVLSRRVFLVPFVLGLVQANRALGEILSSSATVATNVQELVNGAPGSVSLDDRDVDSQAEDFSAHAASAIESTDLNGELVGMGQSFSDFDDPRRLDQPNPEEFGLEVACYSNDAGVSYIIESNATESRDIVFTSAGSVVAEPEIEFERDGTATVESRVFITGAVVFWSMEAAKDLTDMQAKLDVVVSRDGTETPLFETSLAIAGTTDGQVDSTTEGALQSDLVTLDELAELGLDEDSLAVLEALEREGTLQVIAIPSQEHAYRYQVTADESFKITAELRARVQNAPDGTGVAIVLGRSFENLIDVIEQAIPELNGGAVQRSINAAVAAREIGFVDDSPSTQGMCGAMGSSGVAMLAMGLAFVGPMRRRLI